MNRPEAQYTLIFFAPSDSLQGVFPYFQEANTFVKALEQAWLAREAGDNLQVIAYNLEGRVSGMENRQAILQGEVLKEALDLISERVAQSGMTPLQIAQEIAPEILAKRLAKMEEYLRERSGEAAVYRDLLEDLYKAAEEAIRKGRVNLLHEITGKLSFSHIPGKEEVREWGKDFLDAYRRDYTWLQFTKKALEKIKSTAEQIEAPEDGREAELKQKIIELADEGLIQHL